MYIARKIDVELTNWRNSNRLKPLLLRGARQVGKTSSVRHFSLQFENYIEINFEIDENIKLIFDQTLDPITICKQLEVLKNSKIIPGKTLIFLDEVQFCLRAIQSLRYFFEKIPDLHIIATGSLLEFAISDLAGFGVGRISSLYMFPLSFKEYLIAINQSALVEIISQSGPQMKMAEALHTQCIDYLKEFMVVGGMPESVKTYVQSNSLLDSQKVLDELILTYENDFAKYKQKIPSLRIKEVFNEVVNQTGQKFVYASLNSNYNNLQIKEALELLRLAGLIYPVTHSSANGIPIGADINLKKRKYLIIDFGIWLRLTGMSAVELFISNEIDLINKGALSELFVGLEILKYSNNNKTPELYYWQREEKNSQAELDYIIQHHDKIVPVKVKAGSTGSMKSLHLFMKEKLSKSGIRISLENFNQVENILIYPMYAINNIFATT